ncbi:MAG: glycosyltransferase family 2 protein [Ruminococcus sp.]|nr:glycosyltransferase family 2 protein [Ruminococcus sp.]
MDSKKPLTVTAVITTHDRVGLLKRAVESVLSQDYEALDLLVVDDASSDGTQRYMTRLAAENGRVTYLRIPPEETKGSNHARNAGIRAAKGELVAFLDDDDVWLPGKITAQVAFFERHPSAGAVSCDWYEVYCFGKKQYRYKRNFSFSRGRNEFFITTYMGVTSGMLVRKEILESIGGFDEQLPAKQEYELSCRIAMACSIGFLRRPLFEYYHYDTGACISSSAGKHIAAREHIENKYAERLAQFTPEQKKRFDAFMTKDLAYRRLMSGDRKSYRQTVRPVLGSFGIKEKAVWLLSFVMGYSTLIRGKAALKAFREKYGGQ